MLGKKLMTKVKARKQMAAKLIGIPSFPRSNARSKRGCLRRRRRATQEMENRYEESRAATPSDRTWLKATVEPMLTSDTQVVKPTVKMTAERYISNQQTSKNSGLLTVEWNL